MTAPPLSAAEETRARAQLAQGLAFLRSRETTSAAAQATLVTSLADAIARLDSSSADTVEGIGEGSAPYLAAPSGTGMGELQRIQAIRAALLGENGLIARLRGD